MDLKPRRGGTWRGEKGERIKICRCNACSDHAVKCTRALVARRTGETTFATPRARIKNAAITFRQRLWNLQTISPSLILTLFAPSLAFLFFAIGDTARRTRTYAFNIFFLYDALICNRPPQKLPLD